jgi:hypothetical protein
MGDDTQDDEDDCMDSEKGILQSLKDCMNPGGESGVEERE